MRLVAGRGGWAARAALGEGVLDAALLGLEREFDARHGGWGGAPKFPQPMTIEFLLRLHVRSGDARPLAMARRTLDAMAAGGIYDHLGGGFARYATDAVWLVPHFEKMLYDNAQLARVYVHAWQLTGEPRYRQVAEETLEFVARELRTADGGFAASLDADTDGEEGATYVWDKTEVDALLGRRGGRIRCRLRRDRQRQLGRSHDPAPRPIGSADTDGLARARRTLFEARQKRPQPARDDKVLSAWNGLMIAAFADAAAAFGEARWAELGAGAADLLLDRVRDGEWPPAPLVEGRSRASVGRARGLCQLADGLLALYEATFDERYFVAARELADAILEHFARSGRRVLRHGRRSRGAHRATQGPAGQRGSVRWRDGRDGAAQARRADR